MEIAKVQKSLATKALYQPTHRFDDLYRYLRNMNWLESARSAILSNDGAKTPGVDGINGKDLSAAEWVTILNQTVEDLQEEKYCPMPVKRVYIVRFVPLKRPTKPRKGVRSTNDLNNFISKEVRKDKLLPLPLR